VKGVDLAGLEAVDALLLLDDRPELELVEVGELVAVGVGAPVVLVALERQVVVHLPLDELERPGADEVGGAVLGVVELRLGDHAEAAARVEERGERRPRQPGRDPHRQRVDHVDRGDVGQHELEEQRRASRVLAPVRVQVVPDHVGGERRAVVERDAGPQRDRPLGGVGVRGHRLGEERDELAVPVGHGQRVVDRPRHLDAGDGELALGQAPAVGGLRLEAVDEAAAVLRSAGVGVVVVTA
jgi:hypothetical protein